ncbi:MAG TPA: tail fiber protein [Rubrobacter sp.]|jgi:microcystin-dependent protein|nr:tail fiber protein [Rubrobacter sp.]
MITLNHSQALFSLMDAAYGGDGRTTFALPILPGA